jgi:hypothetical protein
MGRRKEGEKRYYPALLRPDNYNVDGCNHDDILPTTIPKPSSKEYDDNMAYLMASRNPTDYTNRRKETGISKPSIMSGLPRNRTFGIPGSFPLDLMHLVSLNITDLLINLWRANTSKVACDKSDSIEDWPWATLRNDAVWQKHGATVAKAKCHLPGSFDRPPRNPAEKINSGYKAWEFLMYIFALGPGLFYGVLPKQYWRHYCKLVAAARIIQQRKIMAQQLQDAKLKLDSFHHEFEELYVQRKKSRIHFVRPALHSLLHICSETHRAGPLDIYTQWTMERTIGNLGEEIRQHSNPYANLSERGVRRARTNALKALIPDLDEDTDRIPRGGQDIGGGFRLLRAMDPRSRDVDLVEESAIRTYLAAKTSMPAVEIRVRRWARLRLPNGQIARTAWKELQKRGDVRNARNVKVGLVHN